MPDYQLEIKQVVDYPRCRIYREFVQTLIADRSIRTNGGSGLFYYTVLCSYANFRTSYRRLDGITQSTLTKQLRELEQDGFLHREIYREIPPRVEYRLTELGESFIPVLYQMLSWSEERLCPPDYVNPYGDQAPEP